jgi:anti-sigma B factor antagonist
MDVLQLSIDHEDGAAVVIHVGGELDVATTPSFKQLVGDLVSRGHNRLVLDLAGLEFIDSTVIGAFLGAMQRAEQANGSLRLRAVPARVSSVLAVVGLDAVLVAEPVASGAGNDPGLVLR